MVMIYAYFNTQILSFANLGCVYMLANSQDFRLSVAYSTEFDFPVSKWGESGIKATYMQHCKNRGCITYERFVQTEQE